MRLKIFIVFLISFFILLPNLGTFALTKKEKQKIEEGKRKKLEIEQKRKEKLKQIKELSSQIYIVNQQKYEIEQKLEQTQIKLKDISYKYNLAQKQVKLTSQSIERTQKEFEQQLEYAKKRIRQMYKYKQVDYLKFLLDAKDLNNFIKRTQYFNYIAKKDSNILNSIKEKREELENLRKEYIRKREQISEIAKIYEQEKDRFSTLSDQLEAKKYQLQHDKSILEKEEQALEEESKRITAMIQSILSGGPVRPRMGTGKFLWPVPSCGSISSPFGYRIHPILGSYRFHSGIDIPGGYGSAIIAVDNGVCIFAGWQGGYGKTVIIDHGGGIVSLYAHCAEVYVTNGQNVQKGQTIAAVGSTGMSTGPHLHFEVRQNGEPVNPMGWL